MCTNYFPVMSKEDSIESVFFCARHSELKFSKLGLTLLLVWESRFVSSDTLITKCKPLHCLPSFAGKQRDCSVCGGCREKSTAKKSNTQCDIEFSPRFHHTHVAQRKCYFCCAMTKCRRRKEEVCCRRIYVCCFGAARKPLKEVPN